jgi:hypothetical protein
MDPHKNSEELSEQALSSTEQCMNNFSDQKNARGSEESYVGRGHGTQE